MTDTIEKALLEAKIVKIEDFLLTQTPGRRKAIAKLWPYVQAGMPVLLLALEKDDLQVLINVLISMIAAGGSDEIAWEKLPYDPCGVVRSAVKRADSAASHARLSPHAYGARRVVIGRDSAKRRWFIPVDPVTISTTSELFEVNASAFQADDKQYGSLRERIRAKRRERELAAAGLTDTGADGSEDKGVDVQGDKGGVCPEIDAAMRTNSNT